MKAVQCTSLWSQYLAGEPPLTGQDLDDVDSVGDDVADGEIALGLQPWLPDFANVDIKVCRRCG